MALEDLTGSNKFIDALIPANPDNTDVQEQGADHLRGIKNVLSNSFPNINAAVQATAAQIDAVALAPPVPVYGESVNTPLTGNFVDFAIPANVKKVDVILNRASASGSGIPIIQLKGSGAIETTGYDACATAIGSSSSTTAQTIGFPINSSSVAASEYTGIYTLELMDATTNTWIASYNGVRMDTTGSTLGGGEKVITGALTGVRIDTTSTDVFDKGTAKVRWYF